MCYADRLGAALLHGSGTDDTSVGVKHSDFNFQNLFQDPSTHRTLTLLGKTVQSVGNLVSSRTSHPNFKGEIYMREVFTHCVTDKHVDGMRTVS